MMQININTKAIKGFRAVYQADIQRGGMGPRGRAITIAGWEFVEYLHSRFYTGGGDKPWAKLAESTQKKKKHGVILVETSELQEAFSLDGAIVKRTSTGLSISIKNAPHDSSDLGMQELAQLHQRGSSTMPARPPFVNPDSKTLAKMVRTITAGMSAALTQTGAGS